MSSACSHQHQRADYTLFDLNSTAERPQELARPYLHQFLASACEP